jgi:peptide deformylase
MKILTYPNPILDLASEIVKVPLSENELVLIKEMYKTVEEIGVGLAAPQVGVNKQILIINMGKDKDLRKQVKTPNFVVINPSIYFKSDIEAEMVEGCLSFPDEFWQIWRPANVGVEYTTISNFTDFLVNNNTRPVYKKQKVIVKGWLSRILQHEIDHLNGKLFTQMGGKKRAKEKLKKETIVD